MIILLLKINVLELISSKNLMILLNENIILILNIFQSTKLVTYVNLL